ncbi:MAG: hypothetical protein K2K85_02020 [Clostridia bacterium]|nr:hypothetical protein [Clostridia bacterium]
MASWKEPKDDYTAGSQVTPDIFNTLANNEKYLQDVKITTEQVQDAVINSSQSEERNNIGDMESIKSVFSKIRKWFADLRGVAFSGSYNDLSNKPDISKEAIGLGNVANERQYSSANPPPYPVTSVNGKTGAVQISTGDVTWTNVSDVLKADGYVVEKKKLLWEGKWNLMTTRTKEISGLDFTKPFEIWFDCSFDEMEIVIGRFLGDTFSLRGRYIDVFMYTENRKDLRVGQINPSDYPEYVYITKIYQILT